MAPKKATAVQEKQLPMLWRDQILSRQKSLHQYDNWAEWARSRDKKIEEKKVATKEAKKQHKKHREFDAPPPPDRKYDKKDKKRDKDDKKDHKKHHKVRKMKTIE